MCGTYPGSRARRQSGSADYADSIAGYADSIEDSMRESGNGEKEVLGLQVGRAAGGDTRETALFTSHLARRKFFAGLRRLPSLTPFYDP